MYIFVYGSNGWREDMVSNKQFSAARHDAADVKEIVLSSGITLSAYEK